MNIQGTSAYRNMTADLGGQPAAAAAVRTGDSSAVRMTTDVSARSAVTVTAGGPAGLAALEGTEDVPESALRRDDALGRLFERAFDLPAPPMPAFVGKDSLA